MRKFTPQKAKLRRKTYRLAEKSLMVSGFSTANPVKFKKEVKTSYQYRYRKN